MAGADPLRTFLSHHRAFEGRAVRNLEICCESDPDNPTEVDHSSWEGPLGEELVRLLAVLMVAHSAAVAHLAADTLADTLADHVADRVAKRLEPQQSQAARDRERMAYPILSPSEAARLLPWDNKVAMSWLREQGLIRQRTGGGRYVSWREVVDRVEDKAVLQAAPNAEKRARGRRRAAPWVDPES